MKKSEIDILFTDFSNFVWCTPIAAKALEQLIGGRAFIDLFLFLPRGYSNRNTPVESARPGDYVTFVGKVSQHIPASRFRRMYRVLMETEHSTITLVFFHYKHVKHTFPENAVLTISGRVVKLGNSIAISHPDKVCSGDRQNSIAKIDPIYSCNPKQKTVFCSVLEAAFDHIGDVDEWLGPSIKEDNKWYGFVSSIKGVHFPVSTEELGKCRERLAFDELIARRLLINSTRNRQTKKFQVKKLSFFKEILMKNVGFSLTSDQESAIDDIINDQVNEQSNVRLLQGDVGSGKTIVAAITISNIVENKLQTALLSPTEVLAEQHYNSFCKMFSGTGVRICLLKSKMPSAERRRILESICNGDCNIVIGTHAIFQEKVQFYSLAFVVIDEQHRFGVAQRISLINKGQGVDLLLMSATPIPRTLEQVLYGSMNVSLIKEKPKNRLKIITTSWSCEKLPELFSKIKKAVESNHKIYWVCQAIDANNENASCVVERFESLSKLLPDKVGCIHGKMKNKDEIISRFSKGEISVLVATTVIEVGVDIPDASIIVIENPEFFGLSQLHQLRGRVGRGSQQGYCILLYGGDLNETAKKRLEVLKESDDGFYIAEQDRKFRGSGDMAGYKQSGFAEFKFFDPETDMWMHSEVKNYLEQPSSIDEKTKNLVTKLFHRDSDIVVY